MRVRQLFLQLLFLLVHTDEAKKSKSKSTDDNTASSSSSSSSSNSKTVSDLLLPYDFIFGFSTGHVGTTALNEGKLYGEPYYVRFIHELHYGPFEFPEEDAFETEKWKKSNFQEEYQYAKEVYIPFLIKTKGDLPVLMDLGHNSLYFVSAMVKYLLEETKYRFIFIRVRRERLESAVSLAFRHPDEPFKDACELKTRFCPYDRPSENILQLPSIATWESFSIFQQTLWVMDETEARWNKLKVDYPSMHVTEILWGNRWPGSFDTSALTIAHLLGLNQTIEFSMDWNHMETHVHAGADIESIYSYDIAQQDIAYRKVMPHCHNYA